MNHHQRKESRSPSEVKSNLVESTHKVAGFIASDIQDQLYESGAIPLPQHSAFVVTAEEKNSNLNKLSDKTLVNGIGKRGLFNYWKSTLYEVTRLAVGGDSLARVSYDSGRKILTEQLPNYAKETILLIAQDHFSRTTLLEKSQSLMWLASEKFAEGNRQLRRLIKSGVGKNCLKFEPGYLDLWELFPQESPNAARAFQQELRSRQYRTHYSKPDMNSSSREITLSVLFDYENPNPHGCHARDAAVEIISYVLKVRVLEDFLAAEDIWVPTKIRSQLLKSYQEPWDLLGSAEVLKVINLHQELQRSVAPENEELRRYLMNVFSSASNPTEAYRQWGADRTEAIQSAIHSSIPSQVVPQQDAVPIFKEQPWLGLDCKLCSMQQVPDSQESKRVRDHVIKLCVLTSFSEDKAIRRLERGSSIDELMNELQTLKGKVLPGRQEKIEDPVTTDTVTTLPPIKTEKQVFLWRGTSSVSSEIGLMDKTVQLDIYKALGKLIEGNEGEHKKIPRSKVFEIKIPRHGGLRIYYMSLEHLGAYLVLRVGNKSTQPNDISIASGRTQTVSVKSIEDLSCLHEGLDLEKN
jgi:putative addiction module killer protein